MLDRAGGRRREALFPFRPPRRCGTRRTGPRSPQRKVRKPRTGPAFSGRFITKIMLKVNIWAFLWTARSRIAPAGLEWLNLERIVKILNRKPLHLVDGVLPVAARGGD